MAEPALRPTPEARDFLPTTLTAALDEAAGSVDHAPIDGGDDTLAQPGPSASGHLSIKEWATDDRPREKLITHGARMLSTPELLGILMGNGTVRRSAVDVGRSLFKRFGDDLRALSQATLKDLCREPGVGPAKAVTIMAALELGRRRRDSERQERPVLNSPRLIWQHMRPHLEDRPVEEFWVLTLDRAARLLQAHRVGQGGRSGVLADPKVIFLEALRDQASSVVVVHNHPSQTPHPSPQDDELTRRLVAAGRLLDLPLLDHVIYCEATYYSYADQARL